jgi:hypothetical protein
MQIGHIQRWTSVYSLGRHWTAVMAQPVAFASQQKDRLKNLAVEINKRFVEKILRLIK